MTKRQSDNRAGLSRRTLIRTVAGGAAAAAVAAAGSTHAPRAAAAEGPAKLKGRIKQSVSRWCYGKVPMEELCQACVDMGIGGLDLVGPKEWPTMKKFGLVGTCTPGHTGIAKGLNDPKNHEGCLAKLREAIELTAEAGYPNVICMSGNRDGISDEDGAKNCVDALKQIAGFAEEKGVTLVMELLNSKVNHKGYMCDHTAWGAEMCKRVGSPRVKLLYDIYHMQIMEGDIIRTIKENIAYIGHVHTGGNPGRNEIDDTQELYYPAIMRGLVDAGYTGWVAHEFTPARKPPLDSLRQAVQICDV